MWSSRLHTSRFIVGLALVIVAVSLLLFTEGDYSTSGAIALALLGLTSIAISRRGRSHGQVDSPTRRDPGA